MELLLSRRGDPSGNGSRPHTGAPDAVDELHRPGGPLDFTVEWPYEWSRLEEVADELEVDADVLRGYLRVEVERRRAGYPASSS